MEQSFRARIKEKRRRVRQHEAVIRIGALLLFLCVLFWGTLNLPPAQRIFFYPYPYRTEIESYASRYEMESSLMVALIRAESKFQPEARSDLGARGLMQLMPETAYWIADQLGEQGFTEEQLYDPAKNIQFGIWYYAHLREEFQGNEILALAAYNAGRGNVHEWIEKYHWTKEFSAIEAIPFQETREYVRRVLMNQQKYKWLYE